MDNAITVYCKTNHQKRNFVEPREFVPDAHRKANERKLIVIRKTLPRKTTPSSVVMLAVIRAVFVHRDQITGVAS